MMIEVSIRTIARNLYLCVGENYRNERIPLSFNTAKSRMRLVKVNLSKDFRKVFVSSEIDHVGRITIVHFRLPKDSQ